ncbi:MAG: hypothetical protein ACRYG8_44155 [Janthinobacterium lividum]
MPDDIEWDWTEDDVDGERSIPRVSEVQARGNSLDPTPPEGWLMFYRYCSAPPVITTDAAAWMFCVATVHLWEEKHGRIRQAHMISRDLNGRRILVVHPDLRKEVVDTVETLNGIFTHCSCGGYDCLESELQFRAGLLFARRGAAQVTPAKLRAIFDRQELHQDVLRWTELSVPRRVELIHDERLDPGAVAEDRHWLDILQPDNSLLDSLIREMYEEAGTPSMFDPAFET